MYNESMVLIVGLGNPGRKYQETRHNIGFYVIDEFLKENSFPKFKFAKKFNAEISEGILGGEKILLAKPQTFMNLSGKSVKPLTNFYKITPPGLVVIHDDIDILLGKIRISKGRGAAGHKGVESIIRELRTKNFVRFRIGVCTKTGKPKNPEKFVLQKFNENEEKIVKEKIKKIAEAVEFFLKEGSERTMNKFNR